MPNISFDIFFDQDFINVTATRGKTAPKAKPEWKVRSAPKLPPKPKPEDHSGAPRPPLRAKINEGRGPIGKSAQVSDKPVSPSDSASQVNQQGRRKPPKLGPRKPSSAENVSDALAPTVSNTVSTAGGFAGGAVNAVGSSVNGVGDGINRYIKGYGDGAKDYGNAIMDWTAADGTRGATAANPLGLSGGKTGGKRAVTSPQVYHAPKSSASKTLTTTSKSTPQKKVGAGSAQKSLANPKPTTTATTPSAKGAAAGKKIGVNPSAESKKPVQKSAATTTGKKTAVVPPKKATPAAPKPKPKAHQPAAYMSSKAASNPVGVSW